MSITTINLKISIGKQSPRPVPLHIAEALDNIKVTRTTKKPSTFRIDFYAHRDRGAKSDYNVLSSPLLQVFNRVVLTAEYNGKSYIVMDGFITNQELGYDSSQGVAILSVTGEDVSAAMDVEEISREFKRVGDATLASTVLAKYRYLGIKPQIARTPSTRVPISRERYPQQNSTDLCFLMDLARHHGFIFYIKPGPNFLSNIAYWGPPIRTGSPQKALTMDMGPASNVDKIDFYYDARAPMVYHGMVQDDITEKMRPLKINNTKIKGSLAAESALAANKKFLRQQQFTVHRLGYDRSVNLAQARANRSTGEAVIVTGQVDTLRYGHILDVPGLVDLRGAGNTYRGTYIVQKVTHHINRWEYKQNFTLSREGTGSTIKKVKP